MTGWTDTHAHFTGADTVALLERAFSAGLSGVVAVGGSVESNEGARLAKRTMPEKVKLALAWDRDMATKNPDVGAFSTEPLSAIGETGLDYFYDSVNRAAQCALFERQVMLAGERGLPVIVHCRESEEDVLAILKSAGSPALAGEGRLGVIHCFTGDRTFAERAIALGMMISFSGIVTFRNAEPLRKIAAAIPRERLLIETDCPYLTPVPLRGQPNEPAFVRHVGQCLAKQCGVSHEEMAAITTNNALRLFQ